MAAVEKIHKVKASGKNNEEYPNPRVGMAREKGIVG